jgi:uncharacterized protein (DUF1501 family)
MSETLLDTSDATEIFSSLPTVGRRHFLAGIAAGAAVTVLPGWSDHIASAAPLNGNEGIVVAILLAGGNDGANMVIPVDDPAYTAKRKSLAFNRSNTLDIGGGRALHPNLKTLHAMWGRRQVAAIDGVAHPSATLSHFDSMAYVMNGHAGGPMAGGGWLGRYLDVAGGDVFTALSIGATVPTTMRGNQRQAAAVQTKWGVPYGANPSNNEDRALLAAISSYAGGQHKGQWGAALAAIGRDSIDLAGRVAPSLKDLNGADLPRDLTAVARLINANLGARVFHVTRGQFDTHDDQAGDHNTLMAEFDQGIAAFYATLDPRWRGNVTFVVYSEFGRRPETNGSAGTDHGRANTWLVIGDKVNGGLHGALPSFTKLDNDGNFVPSVDCRSVFATLIDSWLRASSADILGGNFGSLPLFSGMAGGPAPVGPPVAASSAPKKKKPRKKKK